MWPWNTVETFNVVEAMPATLGTQAEVFNYFFTLVMVWGLLAFGFKALVRLLTRT